MLSHKTECGLTSAALPIALATAIAFGVEHGCAAGFLAARAMSNEASSTFKRSLREKLKPSFEPSLCVTVTAPAPRACSISLTRRFIELERRILFVLQIADPSLKLFEFVTFQRQPNRLCGRCNSRPGRGLLIVKKLFARCR